MDHSWCYYHFRNEKSETQKGLLKIPSSSQQVWGSELRFSKSCYSTYLLIESGYTNCIYMFAFSIVSLHCAPITKCIFFIFGVPLLIINIARNFQLTFHSDNSCCADFPQLIGRFAQIEALIFFFGSLNNKVVVFKEDPCINNVPHYF